MMRATLSRQTTRATTLTLFVCLYALCQVSHGQTVTSHVYTYDMSYVASLAPVDAYEHAHLIAALQGLVNRNTPQLYVFQIDADNTWWDVLRRDPWLSSARVSNITSGNIVDLVSQFKSAVQGVVLYDTQVPATSNVASTIAGADDVLPIAYRPSPSRNTTVFDLLVGPQSPLKLHVAQNLTAKFTGSVTGSSKCDAYMWAVKEYLLTKKCDARVMGYFVDYYWTKVAAKGSDYSKATVTNQGYIIARRGFVWDLDVWADQAPNDDPRQPLGTDLRTLRAILTAASSTVLGNNSLIHLAGFTPWAFKYVNAKHAGVATEDETVHLLSEYNVYVDADACCVGVMTNAAFYQHYPLAERYVQKPPPTRQELISAGYLDASGTKVTPRSYAMFYVGDYDSAAWLYSQLWSKWGDKERGQVPLGWAIDPELALRFPVIFPLLYHSKTDMDIFISGDSGAGYVNPTQFTSRGEHAAALWQDWNGPWYQKFGLTFTGFLINGISGPVTEQAEQMYLPASSNGIMSQADYNTTSAWHLIADPGNPASETPVFQHTSDLPQSNATAAAQVVGGYVKTPANGGSQFLVFRSILESPSYHKQVMDLSQAAHPTLSFVDPLTLGYLARIALGGNNDHRVTYTADTFPVHVTTGHAYSVSVTARNDGWDAWTSTTVYISYTITSSDNTTLTSGKLAMTGAAKGVQARPTSTFTGSVTVPSLGSYDEGKNGSATLTYTCVNSASGAPFNTAPWSKSITIGSSSSSGGGGAVQQQQYRRRRRQVRMPSK